MTELIHFVNINKYSLHEIIAQRALVTVYKVIDKKTKKIFAAKVFSNNFNEISRIQLTKIFNEMQILLKMHHPSIASFKGFCIEGFEPERRPAILIEYAPNGDLQQIIEKEIKNDVRDGWNDTKKLICIYGIASAMKYIHSKQIIHGDLKPSNVLLDENYYPKVCDFGCSMHYNELLQKTKLEELMGTPLYMAPEIYKNNVYYSYKSDVYSFAITVYEIMTDEIPYKETSMYEQMRKVSSSARPSFSNPIPQCYRNLIEQCWSQNPEDRPSFESIVDLLRNDTSFITESVDAAEYQNYINFIDNYTEIQEEEPNKEEEEEKHQEEEEEFVQTQDKDNEKPYIVNVNTINMTQYKKVEKIGGGYSGTVYKIINIKKNDIYAAKVSNWELYETDKEKKSAIFLSREVTNLSRLNSPLIMKFIGYSPYDLNKKCRPVIVSEYLSNGSLDDILKRERKGTNVPFFDDTLRLIQIYGTALGMSYLHSFDILHRDLKPGNILLDDYLFPKICDFGFSKDQKILSSKISVIMGTTRFISPEILENYDYMKSGDVYAFGIFVYEIMMKKTAFEGCNEMNIMFQVMNENRPEMNNTIPESYKKLIEMCWQHDPQKRPTFEDIVKLLQSDEGFITKNVNKQTFEKYVKLVNGEIIRVEEIFTKYSLKSLFKESDKYEISLSGEGFVNIEEFEKKEKISQNDVSKTYAVVDKQSGHIYSAEMSKVKIEQENENLIREVNVLSQIDHPTIQKFIGYSFVNFHNKRKPMIIKECSPKLTLKDFLKNERKGIHNPKWNATKKLINIFGIASAIEYLHSKNVLLCDLTPENIHLDQNFFPTVCEIGFYTKFRNTESVSNLSFKGIRNLPIYSAPEVLNRQEYTKKSDVYSFGIIVYEIVTNEVPFKNIRSLAQLFEEVVTEGRIPEFQKPMQAVYCELILECLNKDERERPSIDEIVTELQNNKYFVTDEVDEHEYLQYIRMIEQKVNL